MDTEHTAKPAGCLCTNIPNKMQTKNAQAVSKCINAVQQDDHRCVAAANHSSLAAKSCKLNQTVFSASQCCPDPEQATARVGFSALIAPPVLPPIWAASPVPRHSLVAACCCCSAAAPAAIHPARRPAPAAAATATIPIVEAAAAAAASARPAAVHAPAGVARPAVAVLPAIVAVAVWFANAAVPAAGAAGVTARP